MEAILNKFFRDHGEFVLICREFKFNMSVLFVCNNQLETLVAYFTNFYKYNNGNKRKEVIDRIANFVGIVRKYFTGVSNCI